MSDTPDNNSGAAGGDENRPSFTVRAQYLKDLSFESPRAPMVFQNGANPTIDVSVDVQGRGVADNQYEVELSVTARANREGEAVFIVEATYAGVFEIRNLPQDQLEMAMLVECPRYLFPFMRQIISDATRNGNFPPLMMEPIDFMGIFLANKEKAAQQQAPAGQAQPS